METKFPTATGFSGKYLVGLRKHPTSDSAQRVGSFVLKRSYQIASTTLVPLAAADGILEADQTQEQLHDGEPYNLVTRESDMAVFKPEADLIVLGYYANGDDCEAILTDDAGTAETWFSRSGAPTNQVLNLPETDDSDGIVELIDEDALHNMFGWEQRMFEARRLTAVDADHNPPAVAPVFDNLFFNAYRRDFIRAGYPENQFKPQSRVTITRDPLPAGSNEIDFFLGAESISAKLYLYRGKGPDKPRYWCCEPIADVRLDTLVITPDNNEADVLWRGTWEYDLYPPDRYRRLEVTAEGVH